MLSPQHSADVPLDAVAHIAGYCAGVFNVLPQKQ